MIQLLFSIFRTISHNSLFNSTTERFLAKCVFKTAHSESSSTDVDALKFRLVQYDTFYGGQIQQGSSECLTGISLSEMSFSFMLEKYIVCDACVLRSPSLESSSVLHITPTFTSSMQKLIMQGLQTKLEKLCFGWRKKSWHVESNYILQPPKYLIFVVNRIRYIINNFTIDKCSTPMDMTVILGLHTVYRLP